MKIYYFPISLYNQWLFNFTTYWSINGIYSNKLNFLCGTYRENNSPQCWWKWWISTLLLYPLINIHHYSPLLWWINVNYCEHQNFHIKWYCLSVTFVSNMYLEGIVKVFVLEKPILLEKEKQFELQHEGILFPEM